MMKPYPSLIRLPDSRLLALTSRDEFRRLWFEPAGPPVTLERPLNRHESLWRRGSEAES